MNRLKNPLEHLLHLHDTEERTSFSFALGVFFGFSPFIGFHTILALLFAFLFRLNRVATLVGVYLNTPWTLIPVAIASTSLGYRVLRLLGHPYRRRRFNWAELGSFHFWANLPTEIQLHYHTLYPFFVGSMICAIVFSLLSYPLCLWFVRTYRHRVLHRP
ncbi:MAG: DUF2062 domain-containing protein [Acidobacteriia bacterium]|nr:DUF2062 domain-containing protein [Terriglobia bacterium]